MIELIIWTGFITSWFVGMILLTMIGMMTQQKMHEGLTKPQAWMASIKEIFGIKNAK